MPWTADRLADYLGKGRSPQHGVARARWRRWSAISPTCPEADIKAMATYVAVAGRRAEQGAAGAGSAGHRPRQGRGCSRRRSAAAAGPGAAIYAGACAQCHGEAGRAPLDPALNLALSTSVRAAAPNNLVRVVLGGIRQADNRPGPHMPGFADALTDKQTADLVAYVRANFTDRPAFAGVDVAIRKARAVGMRQTGRRD